jgi:hypothetical protein
MKSPAEEIASGGGTHLHFFFNSPYHGVPNLHRFCEGDSTPLAEPHLIFIED